jgi:hypothetical protein
MRLRLSGSHISSLRFLAGLSLWPLRGLSEGKRALIVDADVEVISITFDVIILEHHDKNY